MNLFASALQTEHPTTIIFSSIYILVAVAIVLWLGRTFRTNGKHFLANVFDEESTADSVNHLLVSGFYLLNLGYALTLFKIQEQDTLVGEYNNFLNRLGVLLLSLGGIHLLNMMVFWKIRTHKPKMMPPPPQPSVAQQPRVSATPPPAPAMWNPTPAAPQSTA